MLDHAVDMEAKKPKAADLCENGHDCRRGKQDGIGFVPRSPTDAAKLLYHQSRATLAGSGNVSGVKLDSLGNWTQFTTDTNGGTSGGSTTGGSPVRSMLRTVFREYPVCRVTALIEPSCLRSR